MLNKRTWRHGSKCPAALPCTSCIYTWRFKLELSLLQHFHRRFILWFRLWTFTSHSVPRWSSFWSIEMELEGVCCRETSTKRSCFVPPAATNIQYLQRLTIVKVYLNKYVYVWNPTSRTLTTWSPANTVCRQHSSSFGQMNTGDMGTRLIRELRE